MPSAQTSENSKASHLWKKGQSGNPGGRPKGNPEVKALAKAGSVKAIKRLIELIDSSDGRIAISASTVVLDRAWGKAAQPMTGDEGDGPVEITIRYVSSGHA